jgi:hypothetical protein
VIEQFLGLAGVFCQYQLCFFQYPQRPQGYIFEITYWRWDYM